MTCKTVAFRVDADPLVGMGHLSRCVNLALEMTQHLDVEPHFFVLRRSVVHGAEEYVCARGFATHVVSAPDDEHEDLEVTRRVLNDLSVQLVITDLLEPDESDTDLLAHNFNAEAVVRYIAEVRSWGFPVLSFSDRGTPVQIRPNVVVNCHPYQRAEDYARVNETRFLLGPNYFLVGRDFMPYIGRKKRYRHNNVQVLSIFGGSDLHGYSSKTARALHDLENVHLTTILGPAVANPEDIVVQLTALGVTVHRNVPSVAGYMFEADLALTTGGNTLFELAAVGTPCIVLCVRERQDEYASYFAAEGAARNLGLGHQVSGDQLRRAVINLIEDVACRQRMGMQGKKLVDGRGGERIVRVIEELLCEEECRVSESGNQTL